MAIKRLTPQECQASGRVRDESGLDDVIATLPVCSVDSIATNPDALGMTRVVVGMIEAELWDSQ